VHASQVDISSVLGELWRDEVVSDNVALRVAIPKGAATDNRERVILTDAEFEALMACPNVDPELHVMALASRTFGGMRTSDLHAWDWSHIDTARWADAHVPRPRRRPRIGSRCPRSWWLCSRPGGTSMGHRWRAPCSRSVAGLVRGSVRA
jgi:integrase